MQASTGCRVGRGSREIAGFVTVLAVVFFCASCSLSSPWSSKVELSAPGEPLGAGFGRVPAGTIEAIDVGPVCLRKGKSAGITRVTLVSPWGGIRVTRFTVAPFRNGLPGASRTRLTRVPGYRGGRRVTASCSSNGQVPGEDLIVQVRKPAAANASSTALDAWYRSGDTSKHVVVPFSISICATSRCDLRTPS